jgi:hypothetical protein
LSDSHLPLPAYGSGSLADVLPAVLRGLGVPAGPEGDLADPGSPGLALDLSSRVCVLLVDGLGMSALRSEPARAPFLTSLLAEPGSRAITTVFPSTTPIALTSLGTGLPPGRHGVVGLVLRLPDGRPVNTLATPAQVDFLGLQPHVTAFERAAAHDVAVTAVGPKAFDGQGLSLAGLRGGRYAGAESVGERVAAAAEAVCHGERSLTYVYYGDLDSTGHRRGRDSEQWRQELTHVDRLAEQLAGALPPGCTLLVTSDHGMVDLAPAERWDVSSTPDLDAGVEVVAGDPRAVHVHARPGASDDVLAAWRTLLGDGFWVLPRDEAVSAGLYGPVVDDRVRPMSGDVVAVARGRGSVVDSRTTLPGLADLVGMHGSVTEDELVIPLLVHPTT